jgi:hypothetical protein
MAGTLPRVRTLRIESRPRNLGAPRACVRPWSPVPTVSYGAPDTAAKFSRADSPRITNEGS